MVRSEKSNDTYGRLGRLLADCLARQHCSELLMELAGLSEFLEDASRIDSETSLERMALTEVWL